MNFNLIFNLQELLRASRELQEKFNADVAAYDHGPFGITGDDYPTLNGVCVDIRRADERETDDGIWDATPQVDLDGRFLKVVGGDAPGGGNGNPITAHVNEFGVVTSTDARWPLKFNTMYVEPSTEEAAKAIEAIYGHIVSREYW